jgi:CheY-like chemotaxis protein
VGVADPHAHSVLVVDDHDDVRDAFVTLLEITGFAVIAAGSGREALHILHGGLRPCIVFLDACMPRMDGWATWQRIQADTELAEMPVVMVSAESPDPELVRQAGIREFLRKPIMPERVVASLERHCTIGRRESFGTAVHPHVFGELSVLTGYDHAAGVDLERRRRTSFPSTR